LRILARLLRRKDDEATNVPERDIYGFTMRDGNQSDQIVDDSVAEDASPACTALVPFVPTAQWSCSRPLPRPSSIFVTHLIATAEQAPQTRNLRRASASDANAAYTASWHRDVGTGLRARQIA
jgi:hypothetical protein